ncbi:MAG TPA: bifunctional diaminohydroxyphosphoribosylaminopyrimidine deaminase/5-amino-6-(5-phosphoribosylamino)uracil reductase RibD [Pirellulales bacterium]
MNEPHESPDPSDDELRTTEGPALPQGDAGSSGPPGRDFDESESFFMRRALELAALGRGRAEPNPMVGCVIVRDGAIVGEGYHQAHGGPHAEVHALRAAGALARGATLYVTLEPCSHFGKTPPCADAVLEAGVARVVAAMADPFPQVSGRGFTKLQAGGVAVACGLLEEEARALNAPYLKLIERKRPWIIAKWAATLDGKIATTTGDSQWISSEASRAIVHQIRGRVDAVLVGSGTARADDPQLTARPTGVRTATRIVFDGAASLAPDGRLASTAREIPVLVAVGPQASPEAVAALVKRGCEVFVCAGRTRRERLAALLDELGRRRFTNVLVEGGGGLFGALFELQEIDEVHAFIAPKVVGGASAPGPIGGAGVEWMRDALPLSAVEVRTLGGDVYLSGRTDWIS